MDNQIYSFVIKFSPCDVQLFISLLLSFHFRASMLVSSSCLDKESRIGVRVTFNRKQKPVEGRRDVLKAFVLLSKIESGGAFY